MMNPSKAERPPDWPWGDNWILLDQVQSELPAVYKFLLEFQDFANSLTKGTDIWQPSARLAQTIHGLTLGFGLFCEAKCTRLGRYGLAIDALAPIQMWDTFQRLLSHPKVLPGIGRPPTMSSQPALMKYGGKSLATAITNGDQTQPPIGNDPERIAVLKLLIHRSIHFLYLHEAMHIEHRHADFIDHFKLASLRTLRAFEHLADSHATILAMKLECLAHKMQGATFPRLKSDGFRLWGFAVCTLFHLVEAFHDDEQSRVAADKRYPRASLRSLIVNGAIAGGPRMYVDIPAANILKEIHRGFKEAHTAWSDIGWGEHENLDPSEVDNAFSEITEAEAALKLLPNHA